MNLEYYHILKDKNTDLIGIYYTDSLDYDSFKLEFDEDINTKEEIDIKDCPAYIIQEILSNILEDSNHHSWTSLPTIIHHILSEEGLDDCKCANILKKLLDELQNNGII